MWLKLDNSQIQTFIFLKLAVAGHLTLFVARTRRPFLTRPFPAGLLLWSAIITKVLATVAGGFRFGLMHSIFLGEHRPDLGLLSGLGLHRGLGQTERVSPPELERIRDIGLF